MVSFFELSYLRWNPFLYCRTHQFAESEHRFVAVEAAAAYGLFIIGKHLKIVSLSSTNKKETCRFIFRCCLFPSPGHHCLDRFVFAFIIRIGRTQQELMLCTPAVAFHCLPILLFFAQLCLVYKFSILDLDLNVRERTLFFHHHINTYCYLNIFGCRKNDDDDDNDNGEL